MGWRDARRLYWARLITTAERHPTDDWRAAYSHRLRVASPGHGTVTASGRPDGRMTNVVGVYALSPDVAPLRVDAGGCDAEGAGSTATERSCAMLNTPLRPLLAWSGPRLTDSVACTPVSSDRGRVSPGFGGAGQLGACRRLRACGFVRMLVGAECGWRPLRPRSW